ncbi:MAG TPA: hypothetical protein PK777_11405, partial [Thermoguttaceae bacterium]|nr:hypothetical protein [Thermoguttaceae bacterium]
MQRSGKRGFTKVGQLGPVVVVLILASTLLNGSGSAKAGVILNPSFESPTTSTHVYAITDWGRTSSTGVFNNSAGYGNFITNADGARYDERERDGAWNAEWEARGHREETGWSVELAIPW